MNCLQMKSSVLKLMLTGKFLFKLKYNQCFNEKTCNKVISNLILFNIDQHK